MLPWTHKKDPAVKKKLALLALALTAALAAAPCRAALQDGIDIDDDGVRQPGEIGLQLHVNTTPSGRNVPDYPGEVPPLHALRLTPEIGWGAAPGVEFTMTLPTVARPHGGYDAAGTRVGVKWVPLRPGPGGGSFVGIKAEISQLAQRYSQSRTSLETRFIGGWRNADWLLAVNPALGFGLSPGFRGEPPTVNLALKVSRGVGEGIAGGIEAYSGRGKLGHTLPWQQQDNRIFLAVDVDRGPWVFNAGLGYGLTQAADRWTVKAIFELPVQRLFDR